MSGLREKKKERTRKLLLQSARKRFLHKGFASTTTAQIAADADIAEGTLFNYFSSKSALFIEALFTSGEGSFIEGEFGRAGNLDEAVSRTVEIVRTRLDGMATVPRELLQEYFSISYSPHQRESNESLKSLVEMDMRQIGIIARVIGEEAALPVYHHVIVNFIQYAYDESLTYDQCLETIAAHIRYSLTGHFKEGKKENG